MEAIRAACEASPTTDPPLTQAAPLVPPGSCNLGGRLLWGRGGVLHSRENKDQACASRFIACFHLLQKVRLPVANPCPGPPERKDSRPHFRTLQMPRCLRTKGLWRPCTQQVYWRHSPDSICSLGVSGSHFGSSRSISDPPPAKRSRLLELQVTVTFFSNNVFLFFKATWRSMQDLSSLTRD